jgi:hypothetical protein
LFARLMPPIYTPIPPVVSLKFVKYSYRPSHNANYHQLAVVVLTRTHFREMYRLAASLSDSNKRLELLTRMIKTWSTRDVQSLPFDAVVEAVDASGARTRADCMGDFAAQWPILQSFQPRGLGDELLLAIQEVTQWWP